jgi:hypothetical protein
VLAQVGQRINSALGGLGSSAQGGAALAQSQLAGAAQQGLDALAGVTQGNDAQAQGASDGFATGMSTLAGNDNFAAQRAALTQQVTQSSAAGSAEFAKAVTGMQNSCTNTLTQATTALTKAHTDLETNLKQQRQGLECEITSAANLAASHEAPAWKRWIAVALIILVVVIIIAVIIVSGGTALGPLIAATGPILAAAIVGAAVGAVTSGLIYAATNLWSNTDLTWGGLGTAVAVGAVTGAIGGGLGAWAGAAVGGWTGVVAGARLTATQLAAQLASASVVAAGVDAATQFYMGGFSFEHYSAAQLGVTLFVTVVTFGIGHVTARAPVAPVVETPPAPLPPGASPQRGSFGAIGEPTPLAARATSTESVIEVNAPDSVTVPENSAVPENAIAPESTTAQEYVIEPESVTEPENVIEPESVTEPENVIEPESVTEPENVIEPESEPSKNAWEEGDNPKRYRRYKNNLARRNSQRRAGLPEKEALGPEKWWEQHGERPPNNPHGGEGAPDHQAKVSELMEQARAKYPSPKYELRSNEPVPGVNEKPDVAVIDTETGEVVQVYEAARFNKSGGLIRPDERGKIPHYKEAGIPYEFHPIGPNKPPGGVLR